MGINIPLSWFDIFVQSCANSSALTIKLPQSWTKALIYNCPMVQINTLRPKQNGLCFADNIFKCIFLNENF